MGYEVAEEYKGQSGEGRIVKHLLFTALMPVPNPAQPDQEIWVEKLFKRGEEIPADMLDDATLERGERLGSFFTDEELEEGQNQREPGPAPAMQLTEAGEPAFDEMSESELAEYIRQNRPNVGETVLMSQNDPDTAKRLLEAEHMATDGEPRAGVVKGLNEIIDSK